MLIYLSELDAIFLEYFQVFASIQKHFPLLRWLVQAAMAERLEKMPVGDRKFSF